MEIICQGNTNEYCKKIVLQWFIIQKFNSVTEIDQGGLVEMPR